MIRDTAIIAAYTAAETINGNISAVVGSPLSELVSLSLPVQAAPDVSGNIDEIKNNFATWVKLNTDPECGTVQHTHASECLAEQLSELATSHIANARQIVPAIEQFVQDYDHYKHAFGPKDPAADFEIYVQYIPEAFKDESILGLLEQYSKAPVLGKNISRSESLPVGDIKALLSTGHDRSNALIEQVFAECDDRFFANTYNEYFVENGWLINSSAPISTSDPYSDLKLGLAVFLIARSLYETSDKGAQGQSIESYRSGLNNLVDYAGSATITALIKLNGRIKSNILIQHYNVLHKKVTVIGEVYDEWLKSAGTPEIILGALVSQSKDMSVFAIDQSIEKYKTAWMSYVAFHHAKSITDRQTNYRNYLKTAMHFNNEGIDCPIIKEYAQSKSAYFEAVRKLAQEVIDSMTVSDLEDSYQVALKLVAGCKYYFTSAYTILSTIQSVEQSNPGMTAREAALVAAVYYLTDYFTDQVVVSN